MSRRGTEMVRARGPRATAFCALSALSILGHGALLLVLMALGYGSSLEALSNSRRATFAQDTSLAPPPDLDLACLLDELTSAGVTLVGCALPGADEGCAQRATNGLGLARLACRATKPIDIAMIEPEVLNPMAERPDPAREEEERKKLEEEKQEDVETAANQVVDIARPEVEIAPDDPHFAAEYDSKVAKETKGPTGAAAGAKRPAVTHQPQPEQPPAIVDPSPPRPAVPAQKGGGKLAMRGANERGADESRDAADSSDDGLDRDDPDGAGPRRGDGGKRGEDAPAVEPGDGEPRDGSDGKPIRMADLRPSKDAITKATGGSTDYLKDIDEGEETLLNTKRWKYANFFNRVKRAVQQYYNPEVAYRLRDPNGQIYGHKNRLTILKVSLEADGSLRDVLIEHPCGIDFLDDEAVRAFRDAQPFPNPPVGLVDASSHLITFRFGFYFEITETGSWRIFRYSN